MAARAIDLYSGIGGWALGLKMAGVDVVASYEWWAPALRTHNANLGTALEPVDIRQLDVDSLPRRVAYVVGSPPCTQFSFSNRGGNGDIDDGLRDIRKFLEVVEATSPRCWMMENVPRVAAILEKELAPRGRLSRFRELVKEIAVIDMAEFGLPQRRKRMLAGDFPLSLLDSYKTLATRSTLGDVIEALRGDPVIDPLYGTEIAHDLLMEDERESWLNPEEVRMNRESKQYHPVYNVMQFPDPLNTTARTVTALCTRISRESIVIKDGRGFRRLTVRERASLQGFPITYQFYANTYQAKIKMIGNAVPPLITYYVAHAMQGTSLTEMSPAGKGAFMHSLPRELPLVIRPEPPSGRFPITRRFRAAIPNLRFGSGTRIEFANKVNKRGGVDWGVSFYFGTSKSFRKVDLGGRVERQLAQLRLDKRSQKGLALLEDEVSVWAAKCDPRGLQAVWCHREKGTHPFEIVDELGGFAARAHPLLAPSDSETLEDALVSILEKKANVGRTAQVKLRRHATWILAGMLVGSWFNRECPRDVKLVA